MNMLGKSFRFLLRSGAWGCLERNILASVHVFSIPASVKYLFSSRNVLVHINYIVFLSGLEDLPSACKFRLPDPANVLLYEVTVAPDEGFWKGGTFVFNVQVPKDYPYKPPKPMISSKVYRFFFLCSDMFRDACAVCRLASQP